MPLFALLLLLGGCTAVERDFAGVPADQLWTALLVAAESPDYESQPPARRWFVRRNHVHADAAARHISIERELHRVTLQPTTRPVAERRRWRLELTLIERDPPRVRVTSRGWSTRAAAVEEADRLFDELAMLLSAGGIPVREAVPPAPAGPAPDTRPPARPPIDIDDLEPSGG